METTIHLNLTEDFDTLCSIYQISPQNLLQAFTDQISYPVYFGNPNGEARWANDFFIYYLDEQPDRDSVETELEDYYFEKFNDAVKPKFKPGPAEVDRAIKIRRKIMAQWLKAILAERSKYITDHL